MANEIYNSATLKGKIVLPQVVSSDTQEKEVIPSMEEQPIVPDYGYTLSRVIVHKIPECYGLVTYNGVELNIS